MSVRIIDDEDETLDEEETTTSETYKPKYREV